MKVIECDASYSEPILAILNDAIVNSTALYDYRPRTSEMMRAWFEGKQQGNFPVIGVVSDSRELAGFASYGAFRPWPAYKYTVEHSLYVAAPWRRKGVGSLLLSSIVERARSQDYHVLIGGIDATNAGSIALHERFGFERVATMRQVGFKFGRWLDLCFYQLTLQTPEAPVDG
ncbi:MAG TPA: GNAT family N-acetyltransferase [Pirellulales bacterium]|nr:GNAT family N-acetyltransferase [Pirellulales bacterium]